MAPPEAERARLQALDRYRPFATLSEEAFDTIAALAASICQTPLSLITLVDGQRQWFLSHLGTDLCETSREASFCAHALRGTDPLIVPDMRADARFVRHPLVVGAPFIRFYAGAPLITSDGYALGTLCVLDREPREMSAAQVRTLQMLSRLVMWHLELRRQNDAQARDLARLASLGPPEEQS